MTRWSAITRTRGRRSALAYGSRSTTAAEDNLNRLIHHERGRYWGGRWQEEGGLSGASGKPLQIGMGRTEYCANQGEIVVTGPPVVV